MKKVLSFVIIASFICACKKEKDPEPTPEPTPVPPQISIKIDGVTKSCSQVCFSSTSSGGLKGSYINLGALDESIYIGYSKAPGPGTHNLVKYGEPNVVYYLNNVQFHAVSGTLKVTSVDTSKTGSILQLVATLDFKTDTAFSSGKFYNITEGSINVKL